MVDMMLGKKIGMTSLFSEDGKFVPITVIELGPCVVTQIKTKSKDGYDAVQMGYGDKREKRTKKPVLGHFNKAGVTPKRWLREVHVQKPEDFQIGQEISVAEFSEAKNVDVIGTMKGRGFAGAMKRYGFKGGRDSHGFTWHRALGSIGSNTDPGHTLRGKRMHGHMGNVRRTAKNIKVFKVDTERNLILVVGQVPGANQGFVMVRKVQGKQSTSE
ncbi:MAG: 50S ribosomal protein L3 [Candidatus Brocadiia bacterium]